MGGSDQWGNIIAGLELIRRLRGGRAHGLVSPLVTTSAGVKFGKTEAGAVWLDAQLTSPYRFYQFWLNTDDRDVVKYLKFFTWLSSEAIQELEETVRLAPHTRAAQRELAQQVTRMVHGEAALLKASRASEVLFGKEITGLSAQDILDIFADVPSTELEKSRFEGRAPLLSEVLLTCGIASSKGEAKRLIQAGGVCVNNRRVADVQKTVQVSEFIDGRILTLRKGPRDYYVIKLIGG
jgi:tyrosyl-tRNA synthetase